MKKEELRKLRRLYATETMMKKAGMDVPVKKQYGYGNRKTDSYNNGIFMRCQILNGILKTAFFLVDEMRIGLNKPVYELFINNMTGEFITWDVKEQKWRSAKLDMLDWPEYTWHSGKYINPEGNRSIKNYLGVKNGGYKGLLDYQLNVREEELKQSHRRETSPWDQMMEQIPELPKDWRNWVDKSGMKQHYIFYEYSKKGTHEGYCTWCEKIVPVRKPKHNTYGTCKCCGREIQFKARGKAGSFYTQDERVYLIQKCEDGFVIRQFRARRHYRKNEYETPDIGIHEIRRVIYDEDLKGTAFYYGLYKNIETRWIKTRSVLSNYYYYSEMGTVYKRTIHSLNKGILGRTGLPQLISKIDKIDPEMYIETVKEKSYLEQLAKAGLARLAYDIAFKNREIVFEHMSELGKALNIDKARLKRMRENNGGYEYLNWLKFEKINQKNIDDSDIQYLESNGIEPANLKFITERMSEKKTCNYLRKQFKLTRRKPKELLSTWDDYLRMASRLNMDVSNELIFKPKNLIESHDRVVKLCGDADLTLKAGDIAMKYPNVDNILQSLKEKFEIATKKYTVIIPERIEQILKEGEILSLCFDRDDRYFDRINRRESYLFFLRKTEEIEKPYYVLEVEPNGTVRQKRTLGDKQNKDIDEAKKFIVKWQQEIRKRLSKEDELLGIESARLRIENFNELRRTKARIRGGHLAGQLLVEVLEADLMEVQTNEADRICS